MWKKYATEVSVVVIGILLALAADAGRQYLVDRASEREILAALRLEFSADVRELTADQGGRQEKLSSIDLLSRSFTGDADRLPPARLQEAILNTLRWRYYTGSHAVLDGLLSNGRLSLIRSDELRHALMEFDQERSRIAEVEHREEDFVADQMAPYLAHRLNLAVMSASESPDDVTARRAYNLLEDPTFASLLYLDRDRAQSSFRFGEILLTKVSAVRELLGERGPDSVTSTP